MKQLIAAVILFLGVTAAAQADESSILPVALQSLISQSVYNPMVDSERAVSKQVLATFEMALAETTDQFEARIAYELAKRIPNPIQ